MHYKYCFQENGQPCIKWRPVLVTVGGISTNLHVPFFFSFIFLFWSHFQPIGIKLQVLSTLRLRGVCLSSGIYTSTILLNVFKTSQRSFACLALESFFFLFVDTVAKYGKTNTTVRFISTFLQQFFNDAYWIFFSWKIFPWWYSVRISTQSDSCRCSCFLFDAGA